ncbi:uncharacterized protein LOC108712697 isoform X2 [Xenopus laevis]|nr:uncharacterized protein LOC108712697 isoform X2 [Xenopus laevis]XP_041444026.1 uncharacterized protein LOC108712697 isoform X2 [Xenopus laevis]XP_041444027.1 uncharacterized protein LOC108712697 isoform X2 [Xenopus laevis]
MDTSDTCCEGDTSSYDHEVEHYVRDRRSTKKREEFMKSESEDSGVELPPPSPLGSESSYSAEEPESLENPPEPESLKTFTHGKVDDLPDFTPDQTDLPQASASSEKPESFRVLTHGGIAELDVDEQRETDAFDIPCRLEQAVLRSRTRRVRHKDLHQSRAGSRSRHYHGSLKHTLHNRERSPPRPEQVKEKEDPLSLPGEGLKYLESLCNMMEQIAELQQRNQALQQEKRDEEHRLRHRMPIDSCICGSTTSLMVPAQDSTDGALTDERPWEPKHYRKRSSSHTGVLWSLERNPGRSLVSADKRDPHFISVPNLQEEARQNSVPNLKGEVSQWHRLKDLVSKLAQKAAGSGSMSADKQGTCRSQVTLDGSSKHPQRLIFPGLVIRPRNQR